MKRRTIPERLRYHANRLEAVPGDDYTDTGDLLAETAAAVIALRMIADELDGEEGPPPPPFVRPCEHCGAERPPHREGCAVLDAQRDDWRAGR